MALVSQPWEIHLQCAVGEVAGAIDQLAAAVAQHRATLSDGTAHGLTTAARALAQDLLSTFPERQLNAPMSLSHLPPEMIVNVLQWLGARDLVIVSSVSSAFRRQPKPPACLVEQALEQRAAAHVAVVEERRSPLFPSRVAELVFREAVWQARPRQCVSASAAHSAFVDAHGRLLTCGRVGEDADGETNVEVLGHGAGVHELLVPTPVPALAKTRVASVSAAECVPRHGRASAARQCRIDASCGGHVVAGTIRC